MRRLLIAFALISSFAATGCATTTVGAHVQRGLDLSAYRTFNWGTPDALPTSDARLVGDPVFTDHLVGAVEKGLVGKGFVLSTTTGTPDLLIHYHATVAKRPLVIREDLSTGSCAKPDCVIGISHYQAATFVLDIVDARTNTLLWRGWAQRDADDILSNSGRMARAVEDAVAQMLRQLPPTL